jgi:hypothetical protein
MSTKNNAGVNIFRLVETEKNDQKVTAGLCLPVSLQFCLRPTSVAVQQRVSSIVKGNSSSLQAPRIGLAGNTQRSILFFSHFACFYMSMTPCPVGLILPLVFVSALKYPD